MADLRRAATGIVWFEDSSLVLRLMKIQSSAMRSAYQALHRGLTGNDVKVHVKANYMGSLNQRYISDAVSRARGIRYEGVIFGGRKAWNDLVKGNLSKEEWNSLRNSQLYSRGDRTKCGNPNIRIVGDQLWVNDPSARGGWVKGMLFLPEKFQVNLDCYDARLTRREDGRFDLAVTWEDDVPEIDVIPGTIGLDINPDGIAVAEVDGEGNLVSHTFLRCDRMRFASRSKRRSDIEGLAVEAVEIALRARKPVVVESLKFRRKKKGKKFNRMASNFVFSALTNAVERRAIKSGVPVVKVNPAFTSILGALKYQTGYSLSPHAAAAMVIARRGMGIEERQTFTVSEVSEPKGKREKVNLEGRGFSRELSPKAWEWLREGFLKPNHPSSQDRDPFRQGGKRPMSGCDPPRGTVAHIWSVTSASEDAVAYERRLAQDPVDFSGF